MKIDCDTDYNARGRQLKSCLGHQTNGTEQGGHQGNTLKTHQCHHHEEYPHASLGAATLAFCGNSQQLVELVNRRCGVPLI